MYAPTATNVLHIPQCGQNPHLAQKAEKHVRQTSPPSSALSLTILQGVAVRSVSGDGMQSIDDQEALALERAIAPLFAGLT